MNHSALVTGGTGFLGSWLICALLKSAKYNRVYAIVRGSSSIAAKVRLRTLLNVIPHRLTSREFGKLTVLRGDVSSPNLGLELSSLKGVIDIFHVAAIADFNTSLSMIRPTNVGGTRNVFETARSLKRRQGGTPMRVHHVSTVAVAGCSEGWYSEDQFNVGQRFNNAYEQSKFEAEEIASEYSGNGLAVNVYRPAVITGDSLYGLTTNFKMIYQPLHFLAHNLFRVLPADAKCLHSLVPVDKVAEAIALLSQRDAHKSNVYHLVNPSEITLDRFIESARKVFKFKKPLLVPLSQFGQDRLTRTQWKLIDPFVPYFNYRLRFRAERTSRLLEALGFHWPKVDDALLRRLFKFCVRSKYIS